MQVQVEIGYEQLVQLAKKLPAKEWTKLKKEVDALQTVANQSDEHEIFLLSAPTFDERQLEEIAKTRKTINEWRTK